MALPKRNYAGQTVKLSMMELRSNPGEAMDFVAHGLRIEIQRSGKHVATLVPPNQDGDTVIHPDGSVTGQIPLTYRINLGNGGYGN